MLLLRLAANNQDLDAKKLVISKTCLIELVLFVSPRANNFPEIFHRVLA